MAKNKNSKENDNARQPEMQTGICFCSFANELANASSSASMVIRAVLDGAGVTKKEINDIIKSQHLDKRVIEELKEYRAKL